MRPIAEQALPRPAELAPDERAGRCPRVLPLNSTEVPMAKRLKDHERDFALGRVVAIVNDKEARAAIARAFGGNSPRFETSRSRWRHSRRGGRCCGPTSAHHGSHRPPRASPATTALWAWRCSPHCRRPKRPSRPTPHGARRRRLTFGNSAARDGHNPRADAVDLSSVFGAAAASSARRFRPRPAREARGPEEPASDAAEPAAVWPMRWNQKQWRTTCRT